MSQFIEVGRDVNEYPRAEDLRLALFKRAESFSLATGMSLSRIAKLAVGDTGFFVDVRNGANFKIATYERAMKWLDRAEKGEGTDHEHSSGTQQRRRGGTDRGTVP